MSNCQYPIDGVKGKDWKVTSSFGWRVDPLGRAPRKHHNGPDLVGLKGIPFIEAFFDGVVIFAGKSKRLKDDGTVGGFGYYVQIRHKIFGEYYTSSYAHFKPGSIQVKKGQKVVAGTVLAKMGTSGDSTGPHLHFEIWKGKTHGWSSNGKGFVDPMVFIPQVQKLLAVKATVDEATPETAPVAPLPVHAPVKPVAKPVVKAPSKAPAKTYVVKAGDSYWAIADKQGLDYKKLQKLNKNKPLNPGDKILLG